jgi:hypothetical protein
MLRRILRHSGSKVIDYILPPIILQAVGVPAGLMPAGPGPNGPLDRGRRYWPIAKIGRSM